MNHIGYPSVLHIYYLPPCLNPPVQKLLQLNLRKLQLVRVCVFAYQALIEDGKHELDSVNTPAYVTSTAGKRT